MAVRFVAVGDVMIDVTVSGAGHDAAIELHAGGSSLNAAVWAASCGAEATVVGRVGDDLAGQALSGFLAAAGVNGELTVDPSAGTGTFVVVDGAVRADRGANAGCWTEPIPTADVVLVSGYLSAESVSALVERIDAPLVALSAGRLSQLVGNVDVVLANALEAERLTGTSDAVEAARSLAAGVRMACVTLGPEGAVLASDQGIVRARPPRRHPLGRRRCGDAFAAAFLVALANAATTGEALAAGCAAGARAAETGSLPTRS
jgi:sugar/nucleoside kinase (ribokinase family)